MGTRETNKNQNKINNNTQAPNITQNNPVVEKTQNDITRLKQDLNSDTKFVSNDTNLINGNEQQKQQTKNRQVSDFLDDIDKPSNIDRQVSMGSSVGNNDSIGYNQTKNSFG